MSEHQHKVRTNLLVDDSVGSTVSCTVIHIWGLVGTRNTEGTLYFSVYLNLIQSNIECNLLEK